MTRHVVFKEVMGVPIMLIISLAGSAKEMMERASRRIGDTEKMDKGPHKILNTLIKKPAIRNAPKYRVAISHQRRKPKRESWRSI